ncbi:hypothetical protein ACFVHS_25240 [Streptomyces sp. NPDC057746]|uniref:hypothetical protein n=1 Tax=Streptomyces sp. NPDC057746 TaxID=3346237 RepID=UPI0036830168
MTETPSEQAPRRSTHSLQAEAAFRARLADLGATLLETDWLGANTKHRLRCVNGHESSTRPGMVLYGKGVCRKCPGVGTHRAAAKFRKRLAELGVTLLDNDWHGTKAYYQAICPEGHECTYCPDELSRGRAGCSTCGMKRTVAARMTKAEAKYHAKLATLGVTLLDSEYLGGTVSRRTRCGNGHVTSRRPVDVVNGTLGCLVCAECDSSTAEQAFRHRLAELDATLLESEWLGSKRPHRVICSAGHECKPTPNNASKYGICLRCRGWDSNAFYVLTNEETAVLKLGITAGDGRRRLASHAAAGFTTIHRFLTGLPEGVAPALERDVLATLRLAGECPVSGREYFPDHVRALVFDVVDNYPTSKPSDTWKAAA